MHDGNISVEALTVPLQKIARNAPPFAFLFSQYNAKNYMASTMMPHQRTKQAQCFKTIFVIPHSFTLNLKIIVTNHNMPVYRIFKERSHD